MGEALFPHKPPCPWKIFLILLYEIKNFSKHKISPKMGEALFPHKPPCPWITFLILLYEIKNFSKHKISPKMGGSVLPPIILTNRLRFVTPMLKFPMESLKLGSVFGGNESQVIH
jgi:hypothetical protein